VAASTPAPTDTARLFLALWPSPALSDRIARHDAAWQWPPAARRVAPEQWHITLHFLGAVPMLRIPGLAQVLAVPFMPFELKLDRPEVWPGGIAVLGAGAVPDALAQLHADLAAALHAAGLPVESRAFRPHVTLARHAQGAVRPAAPPPVLWRADRGYWLVRSLPAGGGYRRLQPFAGAAF
jgi:2'-5' RNA ligase